MNLFINPFIPKVPTCAVQETVSLGIMGAPEVPPLCRETQSLGQQMLNATVGMNGLRKNNKKTSTAVRRQSPILVSMKNHIFFAHAQNVSDFQAIVPYKIERRSKYGECILCFNSFLSFY